MFSKLSSTYATWIKDLIRCDSESGPSKYYRQPRIGILPWIAVKVNTECKALPKQTVSQGVVSTSMKIVWNLIVFS